MSDESENAEDVSAPEDTTDTEDVASAENTADPEDAADAEGGRGSEDSASTERVYIDPDDPPAVHLEGIDEQSAPGLEKLAELGVVEFDVEERDGKQVITDCRMNVRYLATMATEFHIVERRFGQRWELGSWDSEIRVLD